MGSSDGFTNLEPKNHESFSTEINVITFAKFRDSGFVIKQKVLQSHKPRFPLVVVML